MLFLVRHGSPLARPEMPPSEWELDPSAIDDVRRLADSGMLPGRAAWYSSPEPKARETAALLHAGRVGVEPDLREQERGVTPWLEDLVEWRAVLERVFSAADRSALPGWEPLSSTRDRVVPAVRRLLCAHAGEDLVLVGHATAWTLVVAELTGAPPDLARWERLTMPDVMPVASTPVHEGQLPDGGDRCP